MDISLTPEMERLVREKVASGMYDSPSHVVDAGLMMLDQEERFALGNPDEAREKIKRGIRQLEDGQGISDIEFKAWMAERKSKREAR